MAKSDEQIQRESNKMIARAVLKELPRSDRAGQGTADWVNASPGNLHKLVCLVASAGGAVRYGYTRDGGAYSIGIYLGENSKTYYCNEKEGIDNVLEDLTEYFEK